MTRKPLVESIGSGFHDHLPEAEYFSLPFASKSTLDLMLNRTPKHAKAGIQKTETPALAFGSLFHLMLLQPELAEQDIAIRPEGADKKSNEGKRRLLSWMEDLTGIESTAGAGLAEGKMLSARIEELEPEMSDFTICSVEDYDRARTMIREVMSHRICRFVFDLGKPEMTMVVREPNFNVICKGRVDWFRTDRHMIVEVKTALNAIWEAFSRDCARYGYHRQAALYKRLHALVTGEAEPTFLHVVIESEPPHDVGVYELDAEAIAVGNREIDHALRIWSKCEESGIWPGTCWDWANEEYCIETLSLPKWAA